MKRVNDLEATYDAKSDADLRNEASTLREALQQLEKDEDAPADVQARAFALAREAAWRVLQLRAYDVQILGGHAMSTGALAEMATGEGKTLAAVAPTLLGALRGKGALVVTANDYLARRDADSVGLVPVLGAECGSGRGDDGAGLRREERGLRVRRYLCVERRDWVRLSEGSTSVR